MPLQPMATPKATPAGRQWALAAGRPGATGAGMLSLRFGLDPQRPSEATQRRSRSCTTTPIWRSWNRMRSASRQRCSKRACSRSIKRSVMVSVGGQPACTSGAGRCTGADSAGLCCSEPHDYASLPCGDSASGCPAQGADSPGGRGGTASGAAEAASKSPSRPSHQLPTPRAGREAPSRPSHPTLGGGVPAGEPSSPESGGVPSELQRGVPKALPARYNARGDPQELPASGGAQPACGTIDGAAANTAGAPSVEACWDERAHGSP